MTDHPAPNPNQPDALVEKAARVIYEQTDWSGCAGSSWEHLRDREDYYPLARAVLAAVLPEVERRAKADALRQAAGSVPLDGLVGSLWLTTRADQIEKGDDRG